MGTVTAGGATITDGGLKVSDGGSTLVTTGAAVTAGTIENSHNTFTGDALLVKTKTAAGTGFDMISAKANNVEVYKVAGDGSTTQAQGLTVTAGGATIGAGGLKVTAGGETIAAGGLSITQDG